jgi:CRP-like cAMP-binding protein
VTSDDVQIEMDNSAILANPIYNFEQPTQEHAERMTIGLHYDIPPEQAMEVLRTATASVSGVIADQTPKVYLKDFADSAVIYEVKFWLRDHSKRQSILSAVRSHCWYALRRAGMEIPYPQRVLIHPKPVDTTSATRRQAADMLQTHKIFGCLNQAQCAAIVETCPVVLFAPGENLVTQGAPGESMFVLVRGTVDVRIETNGRPTSVAKLGAGDIVGEMSLLTGDARSATVVTEREVEAVQIGKEAFGAFIRSNPAVVDQLSDLLATRQLANTQHAASAGGTTHEQTQRGILHRIRSFFALN